MCITRNWISRYERGPCPILDTCTRFHVHAHVRSEHVCACMYIYIRINVCMHNRYSSTYLRKRAWESGAHMCDEKTLYTGISRVIMIRRTLRNRSVLPMWATLLLLLPKMFHLKERIVRSTFDKYSVMTHSQIISQSLIEKISIMFITFTYINYLYHSRCQFLNTINTISESMYYLTLKIIKRDNKMIKSIKEH